MRREYLDSMRADGLNEFIRACEELKNCKYVLAENKIAGLLKSIADNKQLYSMFGTIMYGFDYKRVFNASVAERGFALPLETKKAIALVFRILLDIDSGKMPLKQFLEAYFYSDQINESYARFALEVIAPFETYCKEYFINGDSVDSAEAAQAAVAGDKFQESLKKDAIIRINTLADIGEDSITNAVGRNEFSVCIGGLTRAMRSRGYSDIVCAFIGLKYAVAYYFAGNAEVSEILKKLEFDIKGMSE